MIGPVVALACLGCAERQADLPDDTEELLPACMILAGTWGHWTDGTMEIILNEQTGSSATVCTCVTQEEYTSKTHHAELNDLLFEECKRLASQYDFDWDECEQNYESDIWYLSTLIALGEHASLNYHGLDCNSEVEEGCAVTAEPNIFGALIILGLMSLRRRRAGQSHTS